MRELSRTITFFAPLFTALAALVVALISHFSARARDRRLEELKFKFGRYSEFLLGFASVGQKTATYQAHIRFADAINTLNLIASRELLEAIYALLDWIAMGDGNLETQDRLINQIVFEMRRDLRTGVRLFRAFRFRTISPGRSPLESASSD